MKTFNNFLKEMVGTFALVGCEDNPNYQVWGAKSDLNCKKKNKKQKILKMKFKDWVEQNEKTIDLKDFFKKFKQPIAKQPMAQKAMIANNGINNNGQQN